MSMNLLNGLTIPSNFAASPGSWNPYANFASQLSGASQFPGIAMSGAGMLNGAGAAAGAPAGVGSMFPSLVPGMSGAGSLGLGGQAPGLFQAGARLGGQAANAPGAAGLGGFTNSLTAVEGGGGGLLGAAESAVPGALETAAVTGGKAGLLKGLLAKPAVKGGAIGLGAQMIANQFLAPGLQSMIDSGGGGANVGQFGLGAIQSLPVAVAAGMAVGGPLGALAGAGIAGAAGVADAVFDFHKGKAKAPEAMDTFIQAVQFDPTWTQEDKQAITSQIALAKAAGNDNASIIQSLILPTVTAHQQQTQQYAQNQKDMELQQQNLAAQSSAIGRASQPILDLLAGDSQRGFDARTAALNTPGVNPAYAAMTRDLASQQADTQKLMAASLYQQAIAAPYQNYYKAIQDQTQQLATLGNQVQSGYIQNAAQKFLDQQAGSTQSTLDSILNGTS